MLTLFERATEQNQFREIQSEQSWHEILPRLHDVMKRELGSRQPILDCAFSRRAENALKTCRIYTLGALSEWPGDFPRAGSKTYREFMEQLDRVGLPYPRVIRNHFHLGTLAVGRS